MDIRDTIARVAQEEGVDPAYALATAERESNFNPNAGGTGSIRGLFQMTGGNRRRYGVADNASVEDQVRGFARFTHDTQDQMRGVLGRDPTPEETYLGHHFGGVRAGRTVAGQYDGMPTSDVFSPLEMAGNPHFRKAGTMDQLASSITADMASRRAKYGGNDDNSTGNGMDFAAFGQSADDQPPASRRQVASNDANFAQFGGPQQDADDDLQKNFERNKAYAKPGASNFNTDLGDQEPQFRGWLKSNKVPFDADSKGPQDYDMRGFYKGLQAGDPQAKSAVDPNDHQLHYPDYWKTPYHQTFSNESQWADPAKAPKWNDQDQLVAPDGTVQFDDRAKPAAAPDVDLKVNKRPGTEIDLAQFGTPAPAAPGPDFSTFGASPTA